MFSSYFFFVLLQRKSNKKKDQGDFNISPPFPPTAPTTALARPGNLPGLAKPPTSSFYNVCEIAEHYIKRSGL